MGIVFDLFLDFVATILGDAAYDKLKKRFGRKSKGEDDGGTGIRGERQG